MQSVRRQWHRLRHRLRHRFLGESQEADANRGSLREPDSSTELAASRIPTHLIVGLGNPGAKYSATRHNIGFRVVELLAHRHGAEWVDAPELYARVAWIQIDVEVCLLIQPQQFMNRSGESVRLALEAWSALDPATDLFVIYDDLDLPTGRLRLRPRGGAGGHRGIGDILLQLDTKDVQRLRFGVGHPGAASKVIDWVLEPFSEKEELLVLTTSLTRAADAVEMAIRDGITPAMGQFNSNS